FTVSCGGEPPHPRNRAPRGCPQTPDGLKSARWGCPLWGSLRTSGGAAKGGSRGAAPRKR
ncbi:hypothetical protein FRZ00_28410, partial [Streptomyces mobaraensis]